MRIVLLVITTCLTSLAKAQEDLIEIHFSKNIEFLGYLIELGDPADNAPDHPITKVIYAHPNDRDNGLLTEIFTIASDMDYSTIVDLIYYLPEFPLVDSFELPERRAKELGYNTKEEIAMLRNLLAKVNQLYQESKFESIWNNLAPYRTELLTYLRANKPSQRQMAAMEFFYQSDYAMYEVVPSYTLWSAAWGINNGRGRTATFVLGPLNKNYDFTDKVHFFHLSVHEFGHSFVNHVVLPHEKQLAKTRGLFEEVKADMTSQGYPDWESCMIEHFVRAGEVIIPELMGNTSGSEELMKNYVEHRKYIYLPFIIEKLKKYRLTRNFSYEKAVKRTLVDLKKNYISG